MLPSAEVTADWNVGAVVSVMSISSNLSVSTCLRMSIPSAPFAVMTFVLRASAGLEKVSV